MDPVTHALSSLAAARVAGKRLPRLGTAMIVVAGLAPDLDYASYVLGPRGFMRFHRTVTHSIPGSLLLACALAAVSCLLDRKRPAQSGVPPLRFVSALAACFAGVVIHLALDLCNPDGVQLLWPFKPGWTSSDLTVGADPWIIALLAIGIVLPHLFRLINEEIGDRKKGPGARRAGIVTLILLVSYVGYRATLHSRATDLVVSREYHGRVALHGGAFPALTTPYEWRGLAVTDDTIEETDAVLRSGKDSGAEQSLTHYKPPESPALEAGQKTAAAARFLEYARFPLASVERLEAGYRFEIHDLRFASDDMSPANVFVRVDFDSDLRVRHEGFFFASSPNP